MSEGYTGLLTAIDITEEELEIGPVDVWTGSHANGKEWGSGLGDVPNPPYGGTTGVGVNTLYTGYQWLLEAYGEGVFNDWTTERHFYAMSELLTVVSDTPHPGDVDGDGDVDVVDLGLFEEQFGGAPGDPSADFDGDGDVDLDDFTTIRGNWGFPAGGAPLPGAATPEPATMTVLALGGLAVLRRRRR
jgi:hypothetical protein